jgi:hypothetical protein
MLGWDAGNSGNSEIVREREVCVWNTGSEWHVRRGTWDAGESEADELLSFFSNVC